MLYLSTSIQPEDSLLLPTVDEDVGRGVTRGERGRNSPGESLLGRRMTSRGAEKSQQCHKYFLQYSAFASERPQFRPWGLQTCFLSRAPCNLVTSLDVRLMTRRPLSRHTVEPSILFGPFIGKNK